MILITRTNGNKIAINENQISAVEFVPFCCSNSKDTTANDMNGETANFIQVEIYMTNGMVIIEQDLYATMEDIPYLGRLKLC